MARKEMIMRILLLLLAIWGTSPLWAQEKVVLRDGREVYTPQACWRQGVLKLANGQVFKREELKAIYYNVKARSASPAGAKVSSPSPQGVSAEIQRLLQTAEQYARRYPDAGLLTLIDDGVYEYYANGTWSYTYHFLAKICKETHKQYAMGGTYFLQGREKVELLMARTITPEGRVVPFDRRNIMIAKPAARGDTFTAGSTFIFKLPAVQVGALIEYCYRKTTFKPARPEFFFPRFFFQDTEPVQYSSLRVIIPADKTLYYVAKNFPRQEGVPQVQIQAGRKIYHWEIKDPPLLVKEPAMPATADVVANVYGALFKDWNIVFDWLQQYYAKNCRPSPRLTRFTQKLVRDCQTPAAKVARIYHWVQQNIRYIIIKGDLSSVFGSYPCELIFNRKFGCCVDKAVLFSGMLAAVGIKSTPVILNTTYGDEIAREVPRIYLQHAISCVYLDGQRIYLDSTGYNSRYPSFSVMDQGVWCLNPLEKELQFIPQGPPESNRAQYCTTVVMDGQGNCQVKWRSAYNGEYESWIRAYWKSVRANQRRQKFEQMTNQIAPHTTLIRYQLHNLNDISQPFWMEQEYKIQSYPTLASDLVIFGLPGHRHHFRELGLAQRKYALEYHYPFMKQNRFDIHLPANMQVIALPPPLKIKHPYFSYQASYQQIGPRHIRFQDTYQRHCRYVKVPDYQKYRRLHLQIERYTREKIFLKMTTQGEAQ